MLRRGFITRVLRHQLATDSKVENGLPQLPELVTRGREMMEIFLGRVEPHMAKNAFVAGSEFSVADITAFFAVRSANTLKMDIEARYPAVAAWFARISARPSFQL